MNFSSPTLWWLLTGVLVAAELATGTFYLLMVALGCVAGAIAAHLGLATTAQIAVAAVVGGGATALWHASRGKNAHQPAADRNRDVNIDIGQTVHVPAWGADDSARVLYRGAAWAVRYAGSGLPLPGAHVIVALDGNELQVTPAPAR
ncbi:MAG: NfeD family protein [Rubrivivax sp.]